MLFSYLLGGARSSSSRLQ